MAGSPFTCLTISRDIVMCVDITLIIIIVVVVIGFVLIILIITIVIYKCLKNKRLAQR